MYEGEELYAQIHQVLSPLIFAADIDTTKVRHTGADAHVLLAEYIQSILSYMQKSMAYTSKPTYRDMYTRILTSAASMLRRLSADSREAIALIQEIPFSFESLR